jgi:lauroyl/myristoyl acyltransferase
MKQVLVSAAQGALGWLGVPPPLDEAAGAPGYASFMRAEIFRMGRRYARRRVSVVGAGHLPHRAGAVLMFLHHGSFFLSGLAISAHTGRDYTAIVTGRNLTPEILGEADYHYWKAVHQRVSALYSRPVFYSHTPPRPAIRWLRDGGLLGVALDVREHGLSSEEDRYPFLGAHYFFPRGPARLAIAAGVPLIPMAICWLAAQRRHALHIAAPVSGTDPVAMTSAALRALETLPNKPEQWFHPLSTFLER